MTDKIKTPSIANKSQSLQVGSTYDPSIISPISKEEILKIISSSNKNKGFEEGLIKKEQEAKKLIEDYEANKWSYGQNIPDTNQYTTGNKDYDKMIPALNINKGQGVLKDWGSMLSLAIPSNLKSFFPKNNNIPKTTEYVQKTIRPEMAMKIPPTSKAKTDVEFITEMANRMTDKTKSGTSLYGVDDMFRVEQLAKKYLNIPKKVLKSYTPEDMIEELNLYIKDTKK